MFKLGIIAALDCGFMLEFNSDNKCDRSFICCAGFMRFPEVRGIERWGPTTGPVNATVGKPFAIVGRDVTAGI